MCYTADAFAAGAVVDRHTLCVFDSERKKEHFFATDSEELRDEWIDAILEVVDKYDQEAESIRGSPVRSHKSLSRETSRAPSEAASESSHGSALRRRQEEALERRVEEEVLKWKAVAQEELGVRMQLSKDRRAVELDLQQTKASIEKSQRR